MLNLREYGLLKTRGKPILALMNLGKELQKAWPPYTLGHFLAG